MKNTNSIKKSALGALLCGLATLAPMDEARAISANCLAQTPASQMVRGSTDGRLYGTSAGGYTTDSNLGRAAKHAGLLADNVLGYIVVTPLDTLPSFQGTIANGTSSDSWPAAYCGMRLALGTPPTSGGGQPPQQVQTVTGERLTSYEYSPTTGLLTAEIIEPNLPSTKEECMRTEHTLDARGNRTQTISTACEGASSQANFYRSTTVERDGYSVVINGQSVNVPSGTYPTRMRRVAGQNEDVLSDPRHGGQISHTDLNGLVTQWQHDDFGRKVLEIAPDGQRTHMRYCWLNVNGTDTSANSAGCITPVHTPAHAVSYVETHTVNASGAQTAPGVRKYSDALGRVIREEVEGYDGADQPANARLILKDTEYNDWGAAVKVTQPYFAGTGASVTNVNAAAGWTMTDYDALGRPLNVYVRDDEGSGSYAGQAVAQASWAYNGLSVTQTQLRTSKNAQNQQQTGVNLSVTRIRNAVGELVQVTDATSGQLKRRYDPFGNLVETIDAMGNVTTVGYDIRGRRTRMADPNAGVWYYRYNALGEMVGQMGPMHGGAWTTMRYDSLGRMTERVEPEYITNWSYGGCAMGLGKLCEVNTSHGFNRKYTYDTLGRLLTVRTVLDPEALPTLTSSRTYDANGRVATTTYPSGAVLTHSYTPLGWHNSITYGGTTVWALRTTNAWGKAERYETGGSASQTTSELYDPLTGRTTAMRVGDWASQNANILSQTYGWDTVGNLTDRSDRYDATNTVTENFGYDLLNRLTSYQTSSAGIAGLSKDVTLAYNRMGNITSKSDVGTYNYPTSGRTGVVSSITPAAGLAATTYTFDTAGNLTHGTGTKYKQLVYTSFNMPSVMLSNLNGGDTYMYQYGPDHERVKETRGSRVTWYLHPDNQGGLAYEREGSTNRHYVQAMGRTVAMFETTGNPGSSAAANVLTRVQWWHADHLGSVAAITNEANQVTQRFSYDPFGKRRQINGTYDAMGTLVYDHPNATDRGFTGHEHLDDVGIIHMNGRTYDPHIGRFMQADPIIQEADNAQNYNRYSYILNNPLNATDPSGHSFKKIVRVAAAIAIAVYAPQLFAESLRSAAFSAAIAAGDGVMLATVAGNVAVAQLGFVGSVAGGFGAGVVGSGSLEGGIQGAMTASLFHAAGGVGADNSMGRYAAHAGAGCANGMMGGNGCGQGAASAVAGKWGTNASGGKPVAAIVAGGTASVIGGGKFENGAATAAFGYLFNQMSQAGRGLTAPTPAAAQARNALAVQLDGFVGDIGDQLSYIFKSDSLILARNMAQDAEMSREAGQHAHHIVAANDPRALPARDILAKAGMSINSAFNGVFLDPSQHARIHTNAYYNAVNTFLSGSSGYGDVAARLTGMRVLIQTGKFPF